VTPVRLAVVVALMLVVAALFGWQWQREQLVKACAAKGGSWDGASCGPPRIRPILRRDLQRS